MRNKYVPDPFIYLTIYDYDDFSGNDNVGGTLKSVRTDFAGGSSMTYGYTYDDVGNRKSMLITASGNYANLSRSVYSYNYDNIYQLDNVQQGGTTPFDYTYDSVRSRTWSKENTLVLTYSTAGNSLNQYSSIDDPMNDPIYLPHDDNGNMLYDRVHTYGYDAQNRLKKVDGVDMYKYDFAGRRIRKTVGVLVTDYVYDGDNLIAEYEAGTLKRRYIYGPGIDRPVAMISFAGPVPIWYYYHQDALGNVIALSNNGQIVESYEYTPFGGVTIHTPGLNTIWGDGDDQYPTVSATGNRFLFTGREFDAETGLYYYRARMYNPALGRFMQTDPVGYVDSMNLYQYCGNNPINALDPFGLFRWGQLTGGIAKIAGGIGATVFGGGMLVGTMPTVVGGLAGLAIMSGGIYGIVAGVTDIVAACKDVDTGKVPDTPGGWVMMPYGDPAREFGDVFWNLATANTNGPLRLINVGVKFTKDIKDVCDTDPCHKRDYGWD